ncbi:hypothetical protein CERZMDRAFT_95611 [Cercospora zeae-maydis SCOH1-5]|uniref:Uncharacterized protein n=1 Tax=Cercospora zeae-maydis SCOH1-5 TaxID=717836 RepID=A0A6A6FLJ4_9PEZI|nr:hypothetical protein CERZMDRAFT_95611 [Cercospora zeae-maydis SCOH1-5]
MSSTLSSRHQDDAMTVTQASRPGVGDVAPAGVDTTTNASSAKLGNPATSPDTSAIPGAWKSSPDSGGEQTASSDSASSEQQPVTGALSGTSVQVGLHQAEETAYKAVEAVMGTVQSGLKYVQDTVAGHQKAQENKEIHEDGTNYIKEQLEKKDTDTEKLTTLPVMDQKTASRPTGPQNEPQGFGIGIPRDTIESSSASDVSYEHRPKTLPRDETVAREQEKGIEEAVDGTPARVQVSRVHGGWPAEASGSGEAVHEKSQVERELRSKVDAAPVTSEGTARGDESRASNKNAPTIVARVEEVGNWGSETARVLGSAAVASATGASSTAAATTQQGSASGAQPQLPDHQPGQDPAYPHVGTAQIGHDGRSGQSDSIPPVVIHTHGPEPGKGVAPIQGDDLNAAKEEVFGSSKPHEELGIIARENVKERPRDSTVVQDLGPARTAASVPQAEERQHKKSIASDLPIRSPEQFAARAGSLNPVETNSGDGLSAPRLPDESIDVTQPGDDEASSTQKTQPGGENPGRAFDAPAHAAPGHTDPKDPHWSGKESVKEHLRSDTKGGVRENPASIPIAGGQRVGEAHWGESKKLDN